MRLPAVFALLLFLILPSQGQDAAALISQGDAFDAKLQTTKALKVYLEAEKLDPKNPDLLIKIAKQYGESTVDIADKNKKKAVSEKALSYAQKALDLAPNSADAHLAVALCYGRLLNQVPAKTKVAYSRLVKSEAEKAIELDPTADYAWHTLGRWHRAVANTDALVKGIAKVIYGGLPKGSLEESAKAFEKAVALKPDRVSHQVELGITYAEMDENAKAITVIQRGLSLPNAERDDPNTKVRGREILTALGE